MAYLIAPSLLSADLLCLGEEITALLAAKVDMLHLDIMDFHYVPNISFGLPICQAITEYFIAPIVDVHLMTKPVDDLIIAFARAGAKRISIHPDATLHLDYSLQLIRQQGCHAGVALNPSIAIDCLAWCVHRLDFILIMLVNPGFGGQKLIPEIIPKISMIKQQYPNIPIAVDGGVNLTNIADLARAGATEFIAGSAIFATGVKNYIKIINNMRNILANV